MFLREKINGFCKKGTIFLAFLFLCAGFSTNAFAQHYQPVNYSSTTTGYGTETNRVYQVPTYGKQYQNTMKKQYRNASAYDTLADTGIYFGIGFSIGKNMGDAMTIERNDGFIVGNNDSSNPNAENDTTAFEVSVGMLISSNVRFDLSYLRYTGMKYGTAAEVSDGVGTIQLPVTNGGGIGSDVFMLSMYYSLEEVFGNFAGGKIVPYIGAGVGVAFNSVNTYTISDPEGYPILTECFSPVSVASTGAQVPDGLCTWLYDGMITHGGNTTKNLAYRLELGITWKLQNQMFFDFYGRYSVLGKVETSGIVVQDYLADYPVEVDNGPWIWETVNDNGVFDQGESYLDYDVGQETTTSFNSKEKGDVTVAEFGVRFRIMF
jgi:hypothetical protein